MGSLTTRLHEHMYVIAIGWYICVYVHLAWKMCMYIYIYHSPGEMPILTDHHLHVGYSHIHSHTTLKVECPTMGVFRVHHQVQRAVALS